MAVRRDVAALAQAWLDTSASASPFDILSKGLLPAVRAAMGGCAAIRPHPIVVHMENPYGDGKRSCLENDSAQNDSADRS
jgi:hypothetical protein